MLILTGYTLVLLKFFREAKLVETDATFKCDASGNYFLYVFVLAIFFTNIIFLGRHYKWQHRAHFVREDTKALKFKI